MTLNNNYLEGIAKLIIGEGVSIPSYLAFGSDFDVITSADIVTSGEFDRVVLSTPERDVAIAKLIGLRTGATAANEVVQNIGVWNGASSTDGLWANFLVSSFIHTSDFDLEVQHWVSITQVN